MYLLLIFIPLINFWLSNYLGKFLGPRQILKITILCLLICFNLSIIILFETIFFKIPVYIKFFYWLNTELLVINWGFMFDSLTSIMSLIIIIISFLVHFYSIEYMYYDPFLSKFLGYLSLFTFFMFILITSDNFIQMFIGWEGVGLCSFLLINFWFIRIQSNKAAIKAMVLNRIGDFGLFISILFLFVCFKTIDYCSLSLLIPSIKIQVLIFNSNLINIICLFMFIGVVGKSAQIGLHTWLPDAMEGPTPVSALIHAATMVTAGIFLIIRVAFLFENSYKISEFITIIGSLTTIIAAIIGLVQNDVKKIVAYSTCSQLGYMVFACGLHDYFLGLFHLVNHAFFKALLFLGSGSIIHSVQNEQDIRKLGGLKLFLPFTYIMILIGSFALTGFPFLAGFYSKDFIVESSFIKYNSFGFFSFFIGTLGAFITAFYSFRSIFLVFLNKPNGYKNIISISIDSKFNIKLVLSLLSIPSTFFGYYCKDLLTGFGTNYFCHAIFINLKFFNLLEIEFIPLFYKLLPINLSLLGFFIVFYYYYFHFYFLFKKKTLFIYLKIYSFFNRKFFIDKVYNEIFGQFFFKFGYSISYKLIDKGILEFIGPNGLSFISLNFSIINNKLQTNNIYHLLLIILINASFLIISISLFKFFNLTVIFVNFIVYLFYKV